MIRAFTPQSGQLLYLIKDAHSVPKQNGTPIKNKNIEPPYGETGVTCLTTSGDSCSILTGGQDGNVRLWAIGKQT
jgi:WD40 repeat protein